MSDLIGVTLAGGLVWFALTQATTALLAVLLVIGAVAVLYELLRSKR